MSEKKEKQYAVLFKRDLVRIAKIEWFDARKDARERAKRHNAKLQRKTLAVVMPMTRGAGA